MLVYRIGSTRYPANDGQGAATYGGRWNHKGAAVIYAAESLCLAALEILANNRELATDYIAIGIEIPDDLKTTKVPLGDLRDEWNREEPRDITRDIGTAWVDGMASALLVVPSAVIPGNNYLINPAHPDFSRLTFHPPEPFSFDARLKKQH